MKHRFALYCLTLFSVTLLFLSGCSQQPNPQMQPQQQQQPGAAGTTEQTPSSAAEAAKPGAESGKPVAGATNPTMGKNTATAPMTTPMASEPAPRTATLESGTPIHVMTLETFSTKTNKPGEQFEASLDRPIIQGDWTIAKRGAAVRGIVSESDPGGRVKGVASITLTLTGLKLADGQDIRIVSNEYTVMAKSSKKKDAVKIGIGAGIGAAIGALAGGGKGAAIGTGVGGAAGTGAVLATRGDPAIIDSETSITFRLTSPLKITEKK
jgi:hypothetical protein